MRINVVAFGNGVGNSRDIDLVVAALTTLGHDVTVTAVGRHERRRRRSELIRALARLRQWINRQRRPEAARYDLNVMLEHVWPEALPLAACNAVIPNPEWFDRTDQILVRSVDHVWTKTAHAYGIFSGLGLRTTAIGFDSEDRHDPAVAREPGFFHLAGKSRMKGTQRLLAVWARHPEWPMLTVVHSRKAAFEPVAAANIAYDSRYLTDAALRELQNRHEFHLCLSQTEGWGHYIPEAESVGAVVLATDAAPMNELVGPERGMLIASSPIDRQHLAVTHAFDEDDLEQAVTVAIGLEASARERLGTAARAWFLQNKRTFPERLAAALALVHDA